MDKEQVYINLETKYSIDLDTHVYVKDIGEVYCSNDTIKKNVENTRVYNGKSEEAYDYISGTEITTKILDSINNIDVTIIGGPDVLLEIKGQEDSKDILNILR